MPEIVVEQSFEPPRTEEELTEMLCRLAPFFREAGEIEQRGAVLASDGRSAISTFAASGAEVVRGAFNAAEEPFDSIWMGEDEGPEAGIEVVVSSFDANTPFETVIPEPSLQEIGRVGRRRLLGLVGISLFLLAVGLFISRTTLVESGASWKSGASWRIPAWVPLYPGASIEAPVNGERGRSAVVLYAHDLPEKVTSFYARQLRAQAFAVAPVTVRAQVWRLEARGPDKRELTVATGTGESFTWIELGYTERR